MNFGWYGCIIGIILLSMILFCIFCLEQKGNPYSGNYYQFYLSLVFLFWIFMLITVSFFAIAIIYNFNLIEV